ncbi:MAG: carboxypeptidase-like regulatory domain-containing protein [Bacteroidota bacterium]
MKNLILVILMVFSVTAVNAKEKDAKVSDTENSATMVLTGSVADKHSGESLVGVEVKLEGTDLITYTDFDGNFLFDNVKPGEYKLVTNYISYEKESKILKANPQENEIKIKLQSSN